MRTKNEDTVKAIKRYLEHCHACGGRATYRDIAAAVGCGKSSVQNYIEYMEARGIIKRDRYGYATDITERTPNGMVSVPRLGNIQCGPLYEESESADEYMLLPYSLVGRGEFYILTARGDSMTGAGIDDGDLVLVRREPCASEGDIVVALSDSGVTLKRLCRDASGRMVLHPENSAYADIPADGCVIRGVAEKVIKDLTRSD